MSDFNPNEHMTQLKSKQGSQDYLEVKWRLVWFRSRYPNGTIDTEEVEVDLDRVVEAEAYIWNAEKRRSEKVIKQAKGYARFRTVATNGEGGRATGTKTETGADFPDYVEKAETGSVGRALAMLGFGTQFTGDELEERDRIVDSPVDHSQQNGSTAAPTPIAPTTPVNAPAEQSNGSTPAPAPREAKATELAPVPPPKATEQQINGIRKLCAHTGLSEPEKLTEMAYFDAKALLDGLTSEYKKQRIEKVRQRIEALGIKWDDAKTDAKVRQIQEADLTGKQIQDIESVAAQYEQRQAKAS